MGRTRAPIFCASDSQAIAIKLNPVAKQKLIHDERLQLVAHRFFTIQSLFPRMQTNMKILISRDQIADGVARIGQQITRDFAGETVILVGVLKGACLFLSDLARQIELDATFDFIAVRSYGTKKESAGEVQLIKDVTTPLEDKNVILVEDILDTGYTITFLKKLLLARKPRSLRTAVLLDKPSRRLVPVEG